MGSWSIVVAPSSSGGMSAATQSSTGEVPVSQVTQLVAASGMARWKFSVANDSQIQGFTRSITHSVCSMNSRAYQHCRSRGVKKGHANKTREGQKLSCPNVAQAD